ncbi:hypothetical protein [Sphingomonas sp.]|uniref:hypothetical protein n=1 Tax=Sphingomonas sp. TaxID=28214 RepID=UPI0025FE9F5C|nr:hypothetical protein [Sphingomonas sp.]
MIGDPVVLPDLRDSRLLVRHYHPSAGPSDLILQLVDPEYSLRIDLFRCPTDVIRRSTTLNLGRTEERVINILDYIGALARLCWPIAEGRPIARKYLHALLDFKSYDIRSIWFDHRQASAPIDYGEALQRTLDAASSRQDLLFDMQYSQDVDRRCGRCFSEADLPLADAVRVKEILGYV